MLTAALCAITAGGMEYKELSARASRFFAHGEWASAGAMYTLMINEHPEEATTYGHAIVCAGMMNDSLSQIDLTHTALSAKIPVDSIFHTVEKTSFSIGQTSLYEDYLLRTKSAEPWLTRIIDSYLMRYYCYRRNARGMIEYGKIMLEGLPDDENALYVLAEGYLLNGQYDHAMSTYNRIIELNPEAYTALLYLGNYYSTYAESSPAARARALVFLNRALTLRKTPHVESLVSRLRAMDNKKPAIPSLLHSVSE